MGGRIRVVRLIGRANVGGPARQVAVLSRLLDSARFDQRLLVGRVGDDEADYLEVAAPDVHARRIEGLGRALRLSDDTRALKSVIREIQEFKPHIVHTHTAKAGVLGRVAAIICGVPVRVHTFHGHLLHGYFSPAATRAVTTAERLLARGSSGLVAVGDRVRQDLLGAGIGRSDQWTVIPPGIDLAPLPDRNQARAAVGVRGDVPIVALIGRLVRVKRPDRFVEMAKLVSRKVPDAVFLVVGDGPERCGTEALIDGAGLRERTRFLGWRSDVETVLSASDIVALTSDNEGMPVSLIEAGLAGRAAVTTDVGSAAEVVLDRQTGRVVPPSSAALAEAVVELLEDPTGRAALGAAARTHAEAHFGARRLAADTEELYERLLMELRGRSRMRPR